MDADPRKKSVVLTKPGSRLRIAKGARLTSVIEKPPSKFSRSAERIADRLGICLSAICVVHCLLTPVLLLLLPSVQLLAIHESYHLYMLIVLPLVAVIAFIPGFRTHRDVRVFKWSLPGLLLIVLGAVTLHETVALEIAASILGSLCLIRAHYLNRRLCSCCESGHGKAPRLT